MTDVNHTSFSIEANETINQLITKQYRNINGLKVVRHNETLFETYYGGSKNSDKCNTASVTKSVLSLLIGIAIEQKLIRNVDEKVLSFFPEYEFSDGNHLRNQISIRDLLTMTAPFPFPNMKEPLARMARQKDWLHYSLKSLGLGGKIGEFKYSTAGAHILSGILTKVSGLSAREFANQNLFRPLEIKEIPEYQQLFDEAHLFGDKVKGWVSDPQGYSTGGWGLRLSLSDMAKIGQLCCQNGVWENEQVVSSDWLVQSIQPNKNHYGFMWWLGETSEEYMAIGSGGSLIYINSKESLVVAIASSIISRPTNREKLIQLILEEIKK